MSIVNAFSRTKYKAYENIYWVDIDIALHKLIVRRRLSTLNFLDRQGPSYIEYCAIEGIGALKQVAYDLQGGVEDHQEGVEDYQFDVQVAGGQEIDMDPFDQPFLCRLVWDRASDRSWRSKIYISSNMLRHLVELFVTKRIDSVKLSLQLRTFKDRIGNIEMPSPDGFPLLSEAGHLYFRRSQCELLSVYASMGKLPSGA